MSCHAWKAALMACRLFACALALGSRPPRSGHWVTLTWHWLTRLSLHRPQARRRAQHQEGQGRRPHRVGGLLGWWVRPPCPPRPKMTLPGCRSHSINGQWPMPNPQKGAGEGSSGRRQGRRGPASPEQPSPAAASGEALQRHTRPTAGTRNAGTHLRSSLPLPSSQLPQHTMLLYPWFSSRGRISTVAVRL